MILRVVEAAMPTNDVGKVDSSTATLIQ